MQNKFILTTTVFFLVTLVCFSQGPPPINLPQASPKASVTQTIGITEVSISYSRPAARGREIIGSLVPYDEVWRAGANENTRISFSTKVTMGDKEIPAGTYGLHMIPGKDKWTIIINKDHESWGSYFYEKENDVVRFNADMRKTQDSNERLTYGFENISNEGADILLAWTDFEVVFPIKVNTNDIIVSHLDGEYLKNIAGFFWQGYNGAANYALTNNISLDKGLKWADRSISMNKNFTNVSTKSLILRKQGKVKEADALIKEAMPMSDEVSVNAYGYGLLYNLEEVDAAIKIFQMNVENYPESWNVYDSLAEAYQTKGNKKDAIKYYKKALSLAPDAQKQRIESTIKGLSS